MRRTALVEGIAQYLNTLGLARYSEVYSDVDTDLLAVFTGRMPDSPSDALTIRVYDDVRERDDGTPDVYVQIRYRRAGEDPGTVDDTADAVFDALHDRRHFKLPNGVPVKLVRRKIAGLTEPDSSDRWSRPDSYLFTLDK